MTSRRAPLLLLVGLCAGCRLAQGAGGTREEAPGPGGAPPAGAVEARILVFGDYGERTPQQAAVARAILAEDRARPFDLAFHVGDNINRCGPDPRTRGAERCAFASDGNTVPPGLDVGTDRQFRTLFEERLDGLGAPVYLALGNHDFLSTGSCRGTRLPRVEEERRKACLEVQHASPHWLMPARHYVVDRGRARFIVLDTVLLSYEHAGFGFDEELEFARASADGCGERRLCFVVGHYYPNVAGQADRRAAMVRDPAYRARVKAIEDALGGRMAAWLSGHAHELQHLRTAAGYDTFIASATSNTHPTRFGGPFPSGEAKFWSVRWGFGILEIRERGWDMRFVGVDGRPLHCCRAIEHGACEPYACRAVTLP